MKENDVKSEENDRTQNERREWQEREGDMKEVTKETADAQASE